MTELYESRIISWIALPEYVEEIRLKTMYVVLWGAHQHMTWLILKVRRKWRVMGWRARRSNQLRLIRPWVSLWARSSSHQERRTYVPAIVDGALAQNGLRPAIEGSETGPHILNETSRARTMTSGNLENCISREKSDERAI